MGFNTSMIILNDALGQIEKDKEFGKNVHDAVCQLSLRPGMVGGVDICSGNHANAASVIETHHADYTALLAVGGNFASRITIAYGYEHRKDSFRIELLKAMANELGFVVIPKKPTKDAKPRAKNAPIPTSKKMVGE